MVGCITSDVKYTRWWREQVQGELCTNEGRKGQLNSTWKVWGVRYGRKDKTLLQLQCAYIFFVINKRTLRCRVRDTLLKTHDQTWFIMRLSVLPPLPPSPAPIEKLRSTILSTTTLDSHHGYVCHYLPYLFHYRKKKSNNNTLPPPTTLLTFVLQWPWSLEFLPTVDLIRIAIILFIPRTNIPNTCQWNKDFTHK